MRVKLLVAVLLVLPAVAFAQTNPGSATPAHSQAAPAIGVAPGFSLPNGLDLPKGLFDAFWDDPAMAAELQLTAAQKKQLRDAALKQQLAVIDGSADALKAFVQISAILNAEELDDAAYKQQLDSLSAASGKIIHEVGEMVVAPRRVLTSEQYQKLKSLQRAKREAAKASAHPKTAKTPPEGERP
jgi:Spy/CpxP family protein refolding chaperone